MAERLALHQADMKNPVVTIPLTTLNGLPQQNELVQQTSGIYLHQEIMSVAPLSEPG